MSHDPYAPPSASVADIARSAPRARPLPATIGIVTLWVVQVLNFAGTVVSVYLQTRDVLAADLAAVAFWVTLALTVVVFGLLLWCLWVAGTGKNWARIVVTVVIALGVLLSSYGVLTRVASAPVESAIAIATIVAQTVGIALLYVRASNAWYRAAADAG